ncbi:MAG TPA: flagellar motor switch protein FliG [Ktedonobacterales bacterium]|nr:flagellar motor switch protein FliG [Ktedonobacterales bacterium]
MMALVPVPSTSTTKVGKPSGREKGALLLANLGPTLSAEVLRHLPTPVVERIILEMLNLRRFDSQIVAGVLEEGLHMSGAATFGSVGGIDVARDILSRVLGNNAADDVLRRLSTQGTNQPFQFLREVDRNQLADFLSEEHPQTIALVLSRTTPDLTANVLQRLDPAVRAEVAYRIATLEATPPDLVRDVEELLKQRLSGAVTRIMGNVGGVDFLVQVLMCADRQTERTLLDHLDATVPELAEQIRSKMFVFEDIGKLDDRSIQRIIREVDMKELARALRGVGEEMKQAIYRNMSSRAAEMLRDELETMPPMRADQVSRAQRGIVNIVRRLEEQEEIIINRAGENELL